MKESENAWDDIEDFWNYIGDNKKILGIPVSETDGLDLLNALRDIYLIIDKDVDGAKKLLTMLATVLLSAVDGNSEYINEIKVTAAMNDFDIAMKEMLNEKP